MGTGMLHTHKLSVMLFLVLYLFKLIFLLTNNAKAMAAMQKKGWRIFDMGLSTLFLATGLYLLFTAAEVKMLQWVKIGMVFLSIPIAIIGFRKGNKPLATLSVLLIFGAYGMAEAAKKNHVQPVAAGATPQETAKAMYVLECEKRIALFVMVKMVQHRLQVRPTFKPAHSVRPTSSKFCGMVKTACPSSPAGMKPN
jgi:uncharacterized membrane protein SirB2